MRLNTTAICTLSITNGKIEGEESFCYLGTIVAGDGGTVCRKRVKLLFRNGIRREPKERMTTLKRSVVNEAGEAGKAKTEVKALAETVCDVEHSCTLYAPSWSRIKMIMMTYNIHQSNKMS